MIAYPKIIFLFPMENQIVWDADKGSPEAEGAQEYVRADIHESALKRQGNAAKMGMDAAKKDAIWREENAKRLLAESNPAAIESERSANAELTVEVERLQERVAELLVQAPGDAVILATAILDGIVEELSGGSGLGKKMARIRVAVKASVLRSLTENADRVLRNEADNAEGDDNAG